MAEFNKLISNLVAGDHYDVERTISGIPDGQTLTTAWLTIKKLASDDDPGLIQKEITSSATASGQITDTGADNTASVLFQLLPAETVLLVRPKRYYYDIQVKTSAGKVATVETGKIAPVSQITQDS